MAATEIALKSPSIPLFQSFSKGEFSPVSSNRSFEKHVLSVVEGRGREIFWAE
jgi:hypothetical protein